MAAPLPADAEEIARKYGTEARQDLRHRNMIIHAHDGSTADVYREDEIERIIIAAITDYAKPLVERIGELEREYGILERTVQHMEKSYLAEHGTWGNCTWRLKAQAAEARADSLQREVEQWKKRG